MFNVDGYKRQPHPRYKEGDWVISFRGNIAQVISSEVSRAWQYKSHRCQVKWWLGPGKWNLADKTAYYEEVFEPYEPGT